MDDIERTALEKFQLGAATIGVVLREYGFPQKVLETPPEMALGFAEKILGCGSLDDLCELIDLQRDEAAAFFQYAYQAIDLFKKAKIELPESLAQGEWHKITARGVLWLFSEIKRQYPEGIITDEN